MSPPGRCGRTSRSFCAPFRASSGGGGSDRLGSCGNEVTTVTLRILHITTRHRRGGAESNLRHTTELELARGYDVHVAVGTEVFVDDFPSEVRRHPVESLVRDLSPVADVRATAELRRLIRAY